MSYMITRRDFIKAATLSVAVATGGPAIAATRSPNEKLDIAIIGVGGQGDYSYKNVSHENVVALVDVDAERAGAVFGNFDTSRRFTDFRRMFDKMHKSIDAVVVATPDHTHFHPAYTAMELDKHLYLEKPMAHNVWEVRTLTELAARKGLATQLGMQRHVKENMHRVTELIQAGAIGDVTEVHSWVNSERGMVPRLTEPQTVPPTLDYDLWLGPVESRPYDSKITPYGWRFWWDFGTGEAGNWGCHILDIPFAALDLSYPTHVGASGPEPHPEMTTKAMHSWFKFPAKGNRKALDLHWYQAPGGPDILKELRLSSGDKNTLFVGTRGMLLCGFDERVLLQKDQDGNWVTKLTHEDSTGFDVPEKMVPDSPGFHQEWLDACKGASTAPTCHFGYSGPLSETVLLANAAYRSQSSFEWDYKIMTCTDTPTAQAQMKPAYKKGWEIG